MEQPEVFRNNYLVHGLPEETINEIMALAVIDGKIAGEALIDKGQKGSDLFVILEGRVNVYTEKGDKLAESGPGSVLGEVALVDNGPRSATAVCVGKVRYARLPAEALRRYMSSNRDAGFVMLANLSRVLSMRLRNTAVVMEDLKAQKADPWKNALD